MPCKSRHALAAYSPNIPIFWLPHHWNPCIAHWTQTSLRGCDPQKLHFQSELVPADLLTLANDMQELHTAARECSKLFKQRMHDLYAHGPNALLNTTSINSP